MPTNSELIDMSPLGDTSHSFLEAHPGDLRPHSLQSPWRRWPKSLQVNILVSLVLFGALSWYFFVPSTLYLYLVVVCFTCPVFLLMYWRQPSHHPVPPYVTFVPCLVVLFVAWCILRGWAPRYDVPAEWRQPSGQTYYIASLLHNSERILPRYMDALVRLTDELGHNDVFVSIFENDSKDRTQELLEHLRKDLRTRGVRYNITTTQLPAKTRHAERIERLSYMRNRAMAPFHEEVRHGLDNRPFSKVIWINDILFEPGTLSLLIQTLSIPSYTRRTGSLTRCADWTISGSDSTTRG